MNLLKRLGIRLGARPKTSEDLEAEAEARRLEDKVETLRITERQGSGQITGR